MSQHVSRRSLFATIVTAALAPLAAKLRPTWAARERPQDPPPIDESTVPITSFHYDDEDGLCEPDGDALVTTYMYDERGNLIGVIEPVGGEITTFRYR